MKKLYSLKKYITFEDYLADNIDVITNHNYEKNNVVNILKDLYTKIPIEIIGNKFTYVILDIVNNQLVTKLIQKDITFTIDKTNDFSCNNYNNVELLIGHLETKPLEILTTKYNIYRYGLDYTFDANNLEYNQSINKISFKEILLNQRIDRDLTPYRISIEKINDLNFYIFRFYSLY